MVKAARIWRRVVVEVLLLLPLIVLGGLFIAAGIFGSVQAFPLPDKQHLFIHRDSIEVRRYATSRCGLACPPMSLTRTHIDTMGFVYNGAVFAAAHGHTGAAVGDVHSRAVSLHVSWWLVVAMLPPLFYMPRVVRAYREASRREGNFCVHCGYDLRATPARCPECGRVPDGGLRGGGGVGGTAKTQGR